MLAAVAAAWEKLGRSMLLRVRAAAADAQDRRENGGSNGSGQGGRRDGSKRVDVKLQGEFTALTKQPKSVE